MDDAGYKMFSRQEILKTLQRCNTRNAIFLDYQEYWSEFDRFSKSYTIKKVGEWSDWQQVNGFYEYLVEELRGRGYWADFGFVSNRGGGFWGLWYGPDDDAITRGDFKGVLYLQVETKWNSDTSKYDARI